MILGIGIDAIEIERFNDMITKDPQLKRIFSDTEIAYCQESPILQAERFAVRFAAREALFKALSSWIPDHTIPLFTLCKAVKVIRSDRGAPSLHINWGIIKEYLPKKCIVESPSIHLSLTHTQSVATAMVIIERVS